MIAPAKRIIIHAGMPKTGTTSIQAAMRKNSALLRDAGVMYPGPEEDPRLGDKPNHVAYFAALTGRDPNQPGTGDLAACRDSLNGVVEKFAKDDALGALVVSHELLALGHEKLGQSIAAAWQDSFDTSVVVYVRPLREWAESRFKQAVWAMVRGRERERTKRMPTFEGNVMRRLDRVQPSNLHDGLRRALPKATVEFRSFVLRRKQNDLVQNFVDRALPEGASLSGALDLGDKARNASQSAALTMFVYHMLLGGIANSAARVIVAAAIKAQNRFPEPMPQGDANFTFINDEHFDELTALDRAEAERFPDLGLDADVRRGGAVKTSLSPPDYAEFVEWLKPHLSPENHAALAASYGSVQPRKRHAGPARER